MPINQAKTAQYLQDPQLDSDQDFEVTTVNPNVESTWLDGTHSHPQDSHVPHHTKPKTNNMDQHGHQGAPGNYQDPTLGTAKAQPAKKTRSGTSEVSWTKHKGMHKACQMTSENYWQEYETCPAC